MCGIVLAGAASIMGTKDLSIFEKLLYCDTFRGDHSTGVMSGFYNLNEYAVDVNKAAINGPEFLESDCWVKAKSKEMITTTPAGAQIPTKKTPYFLVGHNRYATMGAKTTVNAHPFQVGNVTLVHNGTLINQSLLPDSEQFVVDSHNIAHAINKEGIEETIKKLHGAFTVVRHDMRDNTVNIIRNQDRPFHLAKTNNNDWFGASEEDMLMWILNRDSKAGKVKVSPVKEHFECEVGVQYVFDVSNGKFVFKEEIKHELPVFQTPVYSGYSRGYQTNWGNYSRTSYYPENRNKAANDHLSVLNLKVGDTVKFTAYNFKKYMSSETLGTLEGFLSDETEYVDIVSHGFAFKDFKKYEDFSGKIVNAYVDRQILTLVLTAVESFKQTTVIEVDPPSDESITTEDGAVFKRVEWESNPSSTCCSCLTQIPFDEATTAVAVGSDSYICWKCDSDIKKDIAETGFAMLPAPAKATMQPLTFTCEGCKEEKTLSEESDFLYGHCEACADAYYGHKETKELDNGMVVTKTEWNDYNTCFHCKKDVPWEDALNCTMVADSCICFDCTVSM